MQKIDVMIARLRFLLAEATQKEAQLVNLRRQLTDQLNRLVTYSVYGDVELDRTLGLMSDVQQRLDQADVDSRHLARIRDRAERELESLLLTKNVEHAKAELASLHVRKAEIAQSLAEVAAPGVPHLDLAAAARLREAEAALDQDIQRLQRDINAASEQAARSLESSSR